MAGAGVLGDARSFRPEVSATIDKQMRVIAAGTAAAYNVTVDLNYTREFIQLVNDSSVIKNVFAAGCTVCDNEHVAVASEPMTGSESFAKFLERVSVCFVFVDNRETSRPFHNPSYDFNDVCSTEPVCKQISLGDACQLHGAQHAIAKTAVDTDPSSGLRQLN